MQLANLDAVLQPYLVTDLSTKGEGGGFPGGPSRRRAPDFRWTEATGGTRETGILATNTFDEGCGRALSPTVSKRPAGLMCPNCGSCLGTLVSEVLPWIRIARFLDSSSAQHASIPLAATSPASRSSSPTRWFLLSRDHRAGRRKAADAPPGIDGVANLRRRSGLPACWERRHREPKPSCAMKTTVPLIRFRDRFGSAARGGGDGGIRTHDTLSSMTI